MKSLGQIGLAIVAVVGLVAGITFIKQYQVGGPEEPVKSTGQSQAANANTEVKLNFPKMQWEWDPPSAGQFEQHTKGWHDFWFQNDNPMPVELGLKSKSCKCSDVAVCVLTPAEAKSYRSAAPAAAGAPAITRHPQPLEVNELKGVTVEPGGGGVVRVAWEDKKEKTSQERSERLVVEVWTQAQEAGPKTRAVTRLELPVTFVPALRLSQPAMNLDDLNPKEEKTAELKCWSSTRARFSLTAKEQSGDPCFACSCTPLTDQARKELEEATRSRVLCGYVVRVTARERLSETVQMDLGPFSRRVVLTSDPDIEPTSVVVSGVVRGDISVGTEDEKGRIALGFFPAKNGVTKTVRLIAHRPGLELKVERVEPEDLTHLKVKSLSKVQPARADGRTRWELSVEVPPGSPSGRLPDHSAVLLMIPGEPPRHIRIPVTGNATQ